MYLTLTSDLNPYQVEQEQKKKNVCVVSRLSSLEQEMTRMQRTKWSLAGRI